MEKDSVLEMRHIYKTFPGVKALQNVDFTLKKGEIHALMGENGAGKSTLIKVLTGVEEFETGEIMIDGCDHTIINRSPQEAQSRGISTVYQEVNLCPNLTVAENLFIGREPRKAGLIDWKTMNKRAAKLLQDLDIHADVTQTIDNYSIAIQQMIAIARAVDMSAKVLILDEPTSSLDDGEVEKLFKMMRQLKSQGISLIYISHKMDELEQICDRVTVLRDGTYVGTERVKDTTRDHLIAMMVGRELTKYYTRDYMEPGRVVLKCENIADGKMVKGASFELREGEIIGFAGLVGAGRSETMKCVFGLTPGCTGEISVDGKKASIKSPIDAMKFGIALVPEDRKQEGLYKVQSVRFNSTIEVLKSFIKGIWVDADKEEEITRQYIEMMDTKTPSQEQLIGNLSGGNQQKVMIGRWLATAPKILILDEPTRGVDVGAKSEIYAIMNELVKKGMSIIMISSELPEILNMSDRVYVMCDGRITGCFSHEECVTQEQIMKLAAK